MGIIYQSDHSLRKRHLKYFVCIFAYLDATFLVLRNNDCFTYQQWVNEVWLWLLHFSYSHSNFPFSVVEPFPLYSAGLNLDMLYSFMLVRTMAFDYEYFVLISLTKIKPLFLIFLMSPNQKWIGKRSYM